MLCFMDFFEDEQEILLCPGLYRQYDARNTYFSYSPSR